MNISGSPTYVVVNNIMSRLFTSDRKRVGKLTEELNTKNCLVRGESAPGFIYMGKSYVVGRMTPRQPLPTLSLHLLKEGEEFLRIASTLKHDEEQIRQLLVQLLYGFETTQDVRDLLPETLVAMFPDLKKLPRIREPAWTIFDKPHIMREYQRLLPKVEMYSVSNLLY